MKVKFLKPHPIYGYFPGDVTELENPVDLLNGGYVEPVRETAEQATVPQAETAAKPKKAPAKTKK